MRKSIKASMFILISILTLLSLIVSANAGILGDIDCDGKISASDARFVLRASVGLENVSNAFVSIADADGDGKISAADARLILRASVGLEELKETEHTHEYETEEINKPTCTKEGQNRLTCKTCGFTKTEAVNPAGHKMGEWQIVADSTTEKAGYERSLCSVCGYYKDRAVPIKAAVFSITVNLTPAENYTTGVAADGKYTLENPAREGYIFKGWIDENGNDFPASGIIAADVTVNAIWELDGTDTLAKLIKRAGAGAEEILITSDITVSEPIYVPFETRIFANGDFSITRDPAYDGDIFVVGSDKKGVKSVDIGKKAKLSLGQGEGTLTIDGNKDNVTVSVNGALLFVADSSECNIYDGVKLINNNKTGNVRAYNYTNKYSETAINRIGGAAIINISSTLNMYGGVISNNAVATAHTETPNEDGSISKTENNGCGGGIYNNGTFNMLGGTISSNEALRGGGIYNNRFCYLISGEISDNLSHTYGGAVSSSSSSNANTFAGSENVTEKMIIRNNRALRAGGAIYSNTSSPIVLYPNVVFTENRSETSGGAIYTAGPLIAEGVTFTGNNSEYSGGAIYHHYTKAEAKRRYMLLSSCTFEENKSGYGGAVILSSSGTITNEGTYAELTDCTFTKNEAVITSTNPGNGGAIYVTRNSDIKIKGCSFSENSAIKNAGALAIHSSATAAITSCSFDKNTATFGGAVYTSSQSTVTMKDIEFTENSALMTEDGNGGNGGAIYYSKASLTIKNVDFSSNRADNNAGAIYQQASTLLIDETCSFYGNNAGNHGGVFYLTYATEADGTKTGSVLKVENVTFEENSALAGGAVSGRSNSDIDFTNVKFLNNKTPDATVSTITGGGAVYSNNSKINITDSLFDGNFSGYYGGTLRLDSCESVISNTEILNSSGGTGGALYVAGGDAFTAERLTLRGNTSKLNGVMYIRNKNTSINKLTASENSGVNGGVLFAAANAKIKITSSELSDNTAKYGAVLYVTANSEVEAENCSFTENSSEKGSGGAVYVLGATFKTSSSAFNSNTSTGNGGAIGSYDEQDEITLEKTPSAVDIKDCEFTDNTGACGGAVYFNDSSYTISECEFTGNTATSESYGGGAIYNTGATGTIDGALFTENSALRGGAVAIYTNSSVEFSNITAAGNEATSDGGAIYANKCSVKLTDENIVLTGNKANNGGAVYANRAPLFDVSGAVIENNEATTNGGALYASGCIVNISGTDTVLSANKAGEYGGAIYLSYVTDENSQKIGGTLNISDIEIKDNSALYGGAISGRTNSTINISSTTIANNSTPEATMENKAGGGAIYSNNATVNISASKITGNSSGYYGGAIFTEVCDVSIKDNTLIDGNSGGTGAALYLSSSSSLVAEKLTVTNNCATKNGIIYLNGKDFSFNGITAESNTVNSNGGVLYTSGKSTLTVTDAIFNNNSATNGSGGAIYHSATGKITVSDAEFTQNTAKNGGAACITRADATLSDVTFTGNTAESAGGAIDLIGATAEISGESTFSNNYAASHGGAIYVTYIHASDDGLTPAVPSVLNVIGGTFNKNSAVGGGAVSVRSYCEAAFDGTVFTENTVTGYEIKADGTGTPDGNAEGGAAIYAGYGTLTLTNVTADSNEAISYTEEGTENIIKSFGGVISAVKTEITITDSTFRSNKASVGGAVHAMSSSDISVSGTDFNANESTYTNSDFDNTAGGGAVNIIGGTLVMNNSTFDGNKTDYYGGALMAAGTEVRITKSIFTNSEGSTGAALHFKNRCSVTLTESDIIKNSSSNNGVIYVNSSTVTLEKLNLRENTAKNGGVIYASNKISVINANDCTTENNTATSNGGVVYAEHATVTFNGGTAVKNTAKHGGTVYSDGGIISFNKTTVSENTATSGGVIYAKTSKSEIPSSISISEASASGNTASTGGVIYSDSADIQLDKTSFTLNSSTGNGGAVFAKLSGISVTDCTFTENTSGSHGGAIYNAGSNATATGNNSFSENSAKNHGGAIYLVYVDLEDESTGAKTRIPSTLTMTDGSFNANTALGGGAVSIRSKCEATFNKTEFTANTVKGFSDEADGDGEGGGAIYVGYGELTLDNVAATGNIAEESEAEVPVEGSTETEVITAGSFGGAVTAIGSEISVTGGTFSDNKAGSGGAFNLISESDLTVSGAVIENNESSYANKEHDNSFGGGAIKITSGTLTLDNTTLSGNKSAYYGGTVHSSGAEVNVRNGSIIKNSSGGTGAALFFKSGSNVTIENSSVTDNTATNNGVIYANTGTVTANGLTANGNKAKNGGVIYVSNPNTKIYINNSTISSNTATASGGTVYAENASVSFSGSTASENTAKYGGVAYAIGANISFTDTALTDNKATANGGAIYSAAAETTFTGGTATGNEAVTGGVIFGNENSIITVVATEFSDNCSTSSAGAIYALVSNVSLDGAVFNGNTTKSNGGAACFYRSEITLKDTQFSKNNSGSHGGAIYNAGSNATATGNNSFSENSAKNHGGAIYLVYVDLEDESTGTKTRIPSTLTMTDGSFNANTALGGGAVSIRSKCEATFSKTEFTANTVKGFSDEADGDGEGGGAIYVGYGTLTLDNIAATGNIAEESEAEAPVEGSTETEVITAGSFGGAIDSYASTITINGGSFSGNKATNGGAISVLNNSVLITDGAVFGENESLGNIASPIDNTVGGGAIYSKNSTATLSATVLDGNKTNYYGGALFGIESDITINNASEVKNTTGATGAALYFREDCNVTLDGITVTANTSTGNGIIYTSTGVVTAKELTVNGNTSNASVLYVSGTSAKADIIGGVWSENTAKVGAAVYVNNSSVTANGVKFTDNSANLGGAVFIQRGTFNVTASEFTENSAVLTSESKRGNGGAVAIEGGNLFTDKATVFKSNNAENHGGAVYVSYITNSDSSKTPGIFEATGGSFDGNSAVVGGAISARTACITTLNGTSLTNNTASSTEGNGGGGAIYANDNTVTLSGITATGNSTAFYGGVMSGNNVTATINNNSTFSGNLGKTGPVLQFRGKSVVTIDSVTMTDNTVTNGNGIVYMTGTGSLDVTGLTATGNKNTNGGVFYLSGSAPLTIKDSVLNDNTATAYAGAIDFRSSGALTVTDTEISGNTANIGGGINIAASGSSVFSGCDITGNSATNGGAMALTGSGTVAINGCSITGNSATEAGGALHITGSGKVTVSENTEIKENTAPIAGAVHLDTGAVAEFSSSVFEKNTATGGDGGAILVSDSSEDGTAATKLILNGVIFNENTASSKGGAISTDTASPNIEINAESCTFSKNKALGAGGGAVEIQNGNCTSAEAPEKLLITFTNCKFAENASKTTGAAIEIRTSSCAMFDGIEATDNAANAGAANGGVFYLTSANTRLYLTGTVIHSGNTAKKGTFAYLYNNKYSNPPRIYTTHSASASWVSELDGNKSSVTYDIVTMP